MATRREMTVGLFMVGGVLIFLLLTVSLRNLDFLSNRHTYYVLFDRVERLGPGAAVLAYGAQVGAVSNLVYVGGPHPVMVTLRIDKTVILHPDTEIRVVPATVIGETTVNVESIGDPRKGLLPPGSEIIGKAPANIENIALDLSERIGDVLDQLVPTLTAINKLVSDEKNQERTRQILENFAELSQNMNDSTAKLQAFLDSATSATQELDRRVNAIGRDADQAALAWQQAGRTLDESIRTNSSEMRKALGNVNQFAERNQRPLNETIERLNKSADTLNQILTSIQKGQGTLGALVTDPRPFEQLRELINTLSNSLTGGRQPIVSFPQREAPAPKQNRLTPQEQR